jgi:C4-dicarboxylate-specific signal transduction histidine kinase
VTRKREVSSSCSLVDLLLLSVSVTDTGMGIDPAALPLLFEPYSQAKLSVMRSFGGQSMGEIREVAVKPS